MFDGAAASLPAWGFFPKINLQTMPKTIVLCRIAEYETHGSEHEPCKAQNNKPAKFNGEV
jgi:hypothetical protein